MKAREGDEALSMVTSSCLVAGVPESPGIHALFSLVISAEYMPPCGAKSMTIAEVLSSGNSYLNVT